jgi:DNA-binding transcriptional regulator YiaG
MGDRASASGGLFRRRLNGSCTIGLRPKDTSKARTASRPNRHEGESARRRDLPKMTPDEYRQAIERLGLSQVAAARLLGVDARTSRRWASGERDVPPPAVRFLRSLLPQRKPATRPCECWATDEQVAALGNRQERRPSKCASHLGRSLHVRIDRVVRRPALLFPFEGGTISARGVGLRRSDPGGVTGSKITPQRHRRVALRDLTPALPAC